MITLTLYSTLGCHLCEQALDVISPIINKQKFALQEVDISESDELMERYGIRIPVLLRSDNLKELGWPFDQQQATEFLR